ncbi:MAG: right-handed parallel beta-helix repeat-containing protein [Planctomycetes bacterium]|nr:right-handed parallel beta-helix repeat-containing protein [Planctomycetota bacterium]
MPQFIKSFLAITILACACLSQLVAQSADDTIGVRDESKVGCPDFVTRDAAADEIQITKGPMKIEKSGNYILMNNITVKSSAFAICAADIVLDLNGYTITYGTGVTNIEGEGKQKGIKTYTSWVDYWPKGKSMRKKHPELKSKNLGHSAVVCPANPAETQDWKGSFPHNLGNGDKAKGLVIKNGRITQGKGKGLAFSPGLLLGGARGAQVHNLIIDVAAPDSQAVVMGPLSKIYNCSFNSTVTEVSNRHAQLPSVRLGKGSEIYHCFIDGSPQVGIKATDDSHIHDNIIKMRVTVTNGYGVQGYRQKNVQVHHNTIIPYEGRGVHISERGSNWDVHHNYIEVRVGPNKEYPLGGRMKMTEHGIKLETTTNSQVHNNVVMSVSIVGGFPTSLNIDVKPDSNNQVFKNTFIALDRHNKYAHAIYLMNKTGASLKIEDNTFYSNRWMFHYYWGGTSNNTFRRCSFIKLQPSTAEGFVDFANTNPSINNLFVDCQFDGYDPKVSRIREKEEKDWRGDAEYAIAWSLGLEVVNGGSKVADATFTVSNKAGEEVLSGKADANGVCHMDLKEYTVRYAKGAEATETIQHGTYTVKIETAGKSGSFEIKPSQPMKGTFDLASSKADLKAQALVKPKERAIDAFWRERMKLALAEKSP